MAFVSSWAPCGSCPAQAATRSPSFLRHAPRRGLVRLSTAQASANDATGDVHVLPETTHLKALMTIVRDRDTPAADWIHSADAAMRKVVEYGLNFLPVAPREVITPVDSAKYTGVAFGDRIVGVSILRSGEAMETALRSCLRGVPIGKILIQRDETTAAPQLIYSKLPDFISGGHVLLLDPMLATGGSMLTAIRVLLEANVPEDKIIALTVFATVEGVRAVQKEHPRVVIVAGEVDPRLNERKYIWPGCGDFGDRYFGTEATGGSSVDPGPTRQTFPSQQWELFARQFAGNWAGPIHIYRVVHGQTDTVVPMDRKYSNFHVRASAELGTGTWEGRSVPEDEQATLDDVDPYLKFDLTARMISPKAGYVALPGVVANHRWINPANPDLPTGLEANFMSSDGRRCMLIVRFEVVEGTRQLASVTAASLHDRDAVGAPELPVAYALNDVATVLAAPPNASYAVDVDPEGNGNWTDEVVDWQGPDAWGFTGTSSRCVQSLRDGFFFSVPALPGPGDVLILGHCILPRGAAQVFAVGLGDQLQGTTYRTYVFGDYPMPQLEAKYWQPAS